MIGYSFNLKCLVHVPFFLIYIFPPASTYSTKNFYQFFFCFEQNYFLLCKLVLKTFTIGFSHLSAIA